MRGGELAADEHPVKIKGLGRDVHSGLGRERGALEPPAVLMLYARCTPAELLLYTRCTPVVRRCMPGVHMQCVSHPPYAR